MCLKFFYSTAHMFTQIRAMPGEKTSRLFCSQSKGLENWIFRKSNNKALWKWAQQEVRQHWFYCLINSSLYTGTVQGWWSTPYGQYTVRPMSRMRLTSLQKCNRAQWQMLFHPTALTLEFCNALTFGQMCISCSYCAFTGCNVTHNSISSWLV
jgi:hypothetical protein